VVGYPQRGLLIADAYRGVSCFYFAFGKPDGACQAMPKERRVGIALQKTLQGAAYPLLNQNGIHLFQVGKQTGMPGYRHLLLLDVLLDKFLGKAGHQEHFSRLIENAPGIFLAPLEHLPALSGQIGGFGESRLGIERRKGRNEIADDKI
jgi:hypothetical protein